MPQARIAAFEMQTFVMGVWTNYSQVENTVSAEATPIGCFYRDISGYPDPARTQLQAQVREYTVFLIEQAWPAQRRGKSTDVATRRLSALEQELVRFEPATLGQQVLHTETFREYNEVAGLRRQRLHAILSGKSQMMPVALAARLATNVSKAI